MTRKPANSYVDQIDNSETRQAHSTGYQYGLEEGKTDQEAYLDEFQPDHVAALIGEECDRCADGDPRSRAFCQGWGAGYADGASGVERDVLEWMTRDEIEAALAAMKEDRGATSPPVKVSLDRALAAVDPALDEAGNDWRRFQVSYPEVTTEHWRIRHQHDSPVHRLARVYQIMLEGLDRDPGPSAGPEVVVEQRDEEVPDGWRAWMSNTRVEISEHFPLFDKLAQAAPGSTVLINGLGLGVAVHGALLFPNVAHVDVVEIAGELVELLRPFFDPDRVTFHVGDALTYRFPPGQGWDFAWHDIWPNISPSNVEPMQRLHRRYQNRTGWQDSWQREGHLSHWPEARLERDILQSLTEQAEAAAHPGGPKEYWREKEVGRRVGRNRHRMTNEEFEKRWAEYEAVAAERAKFWEEDDEGEFVA